MKLTHNKFKSRSGLDKLKKSGYLFRLHLTYCCRVGLTWWMVFDVFWMINQKMSFLHLKFFGLHRPLRGGGREKTKKRKFVFLKEEEEKSQRESFVVLCVCNVFLGFFFVFVFVFCFLFLFVLVFFLC